MEELVELLHASLMYLSLAEMCAESHIGKFCLLLLNLEKASLDRVLNYELDRCNGFGLTESMLTRQKMSSLSR